MEAIKSYVYYPCLNLYWDSKYYLTRAIEYVSTTLFDEERQKYVRAPDDAAGGHPQ